MGRPRTPGRVGPCRPAHGGPRDGLAGPGRISAAGGTDEGEGQRTRETVAPLAEALGIPVDTELGRGDREIGAILVEPMQGAAGAIPADPAWLFGLRDLAYDAGIVLVFDEVMTSRLAPGGLQEKHGILPDMTTLGKYVGGGMSFGAFGGKSAVPVKTLILSCPFEAASTCFDQSR